MNFDKFWFYVHYLIILGVLIGPFVLPVCFINVYILILIIIIIQWYLLNGQCFISMMHKESSDNNGAISNFLSKNKIKVNDKFIDAIFYFLIIMSFYRLDCFKEGLLIICIIILLNKTITGSYGFAWSEKKIKKNYIL